MVSPAWVAALPSDDDEEVRVQSSRFSPETSGPVSVTEFHIEEDDDVQVLNVTKIEPPKTDARNSICTSAEAFNPFLTENNLNSDRAVHLLESSETSMHKHIQISPRKRKKNARRQQRRLRSRADDCQVLSGVSIDGGTNGTSIRLHSRELGILGGGFASQLRDSRILAEGGSSAQRREQHVLRNRRNLEYSISETTLMAQARSNGKIPGPGQYVTFGGSLTDHVSNDDSRQFREWTGHEDRFAVPLRQQVVLPAWAIPLFVESGLPKSESMVGPINRERILTPQSDHSGRQHVDHEQFTTSLDASQVREWAFRGDAAHPREWAYRGSDPVPTPTTLESTATGNVITGLWGNLHGYVSTNFSQLHLNILHFCRAYELTPEQMQVRQEALEYVRSVVHEIWPTAEVHLFGSTATGLALPWSDIDIAIMSSPQFCGGQKPTTMSWLSALGTHLVRFGCCKSVEKIPHAKVPLLKVLFKSGIACDISFDAHNGPRGVTVIREFMRQYEALRPLCLVLKFFLGQQHLNELYTGGLGSFCLINMVVSHLQKLGVCGGGYDFGALLLSFFEHYSSLHNYKTDVVSTRANFCASKQAKGWVNDRHPDLLAVEDPLDPTSDIAKGSYRIQEIRLRFLAAHSSLTAHWHQNNVLWQIVDMTGDPTQRPMPLKLSSRQSKQKRKRFDFIGGDLEDPHKGQLQRKPKTHLKQQGMDLANKVPKKPKKPKKSKKYKNNLKNGRKTASSFRDSNLSP